MNVASTSKEAYASIYKKLGIKQSIVYQTVKQLGKATNDDIADSQGWPINQVTGRVTELSVCGLLIQVGYGKSRTGRKCKLWAARDLNDKRLFEISRETNDCEA